MDADNFCNICLLQFGNKFVYDIHMSFVHKIVAQHDDSDKLKEVKEAYFREKINF